ncbi:BTB/POZ and MATH domain-containing protein 3-like [Panicum virgatum]|nr:BTB/POZ and MATH domain-containing protein 3-like [Panicum virgatum]
MAGDGAGSASAIVSGDASGYHVLRIEGYSRIKSTIPNGEVVESRPFSAAGHTWVVRYFPNGNLPENADYISIYLVLKDTVANHLMVQLVFSFIDQVEMQKRSCVPTVEPNKFVSHGSWGRAKFVRRAELEQSARLKDDCFTVRCDIVVIGKPRAVDTAAAAPSILVPPPDWLQHFRALLLSEQGADVWFHVGDQTFAAHRCVLSARSPVFNAQLFGAMREGAASATRDCIHIDDMMPQVSEALRHFVYTDALPETDGKDEAAASPAMAQHLLEASDRYDMQRLKMICEDRLCRQIDVSTVATTLALAEQHRCQGLKEACYEFLKSPKTLDAVMATDEFQHLVKSCPSALFELMSKLAAR